MKQDPPMSAARRLDSLPIGSTNSRRCHDHSDLASD